jgi:hypothetical protein
MPPLGDENWKDADGVKGVAGLYDIPLREAEKDQQGRFFNLKAYAINCNRLEDLFGRAGRSRRKFIKKAFPNLQRLYVFTVPWQQDGGMDLQEQLKALVEDLDAVTKVRLIATIITEDDKPMQWCARPCPILESAKGTMTLMNIHVRQPNHEKQDMLAFMHRIIDDIDKEWAPEAFQGQRWDPETRPAYIYGVPSVSSVKMQGGPLPLQMKHMQTWKMSSAYT